MPWSPSIEKQIGRHVSGILPKLTTVSLDFERKRGTSTSASIGKEPTPCPPPKSSWGQISVVFSAILAATTWAPPICRLEPCLSGATRAALVRAVRHPIYYPPALFWWYFYRSLCAADLRRAGHRGLGHFIAIAVAIGMSVWRAREGEERRHLWLGAMRPGRNPR